MNSGIKTNEKIEKIWNEIANAPKLNSKEIEQQIRKSIKRNIRYMKVASNFWLILVFLMFFALFINLVKEDYSNAVVCGLLLLFDLFQFVDTYFYVRAYSNKNLVIHTKSMEESEKDEI